MDADLAPAQAAKTMIHETAHALLHADPGGHRVDTLDVEAHRGIREVEAESVAYVVAGLCGLDTSAYSVGYITGWAEYFAVKWVTYAIASDPSVLRQKVESARPASFDLTNSIKVQLGPQHLPNRLRIADVEAMLTPQRGWFSVNEKSDWDRYTGLMGSKYQTAARKLTADDHLVLDLCRHLRNVAAHKSDESVAGLTKMVTLPALMSWDVKSAKKNPELSRQRGIARDKLGRYLAAEQKNPYEGRQNTRLAFLLGYMRRTAGKLNP